jgi:hypothetical protein
MKKHPAALLFTVVTVLTAQLAVAQGFRGMPTAGPGAYYSADDRFDMAPGIGEPLPDIAIVNRDGKPVNIRDITGEHYTVLVLGCLT